MFHAARQRLPSTSNDGTVIIVDTNVLSEAMRPVPEPAVTDWLRHHGAEIVVTSVTAAELLFGASRLPEGARKRALESAIASVLEAVEVLPFGRQQAALYASIRSHQESVGIVAGSLDVQIAAIAKAGGHTLATRNVKHFEGAGIPLINPWTDD